MLLCSFWMVGSLCMIYPLVLSCRYFLWLLCWRESCSCTSSTTARGIQTLCYAFVLWDSQMSSTALATWCRSSWHGLTTLLFSPQCCLSYRYKVPASSTKEADTAASCLSSEGFCSMRHPPRLVLRFVMLRTQALGDCTKTCKGLSTS